MTDFASLQLRIDSLEAELATRRLRDLELASRRAEQASALLARTTDRSAAAMLRMDRSTTGVVRSLSFITKGFLAIAGVRGAIETISKIEQGLVGIAKTTNGTDAELAKIEERFKSLASTSNVPIEKLLDFGRVAAQLGIRGADNLAKFAETMGNLTLSISNIHPDEAAKRLAKLMTLTATAPENVDRLASSLVQLGNTIIGAEEEILRASTFIGASLATFGVSADQVLALSAATVALGQRAETSATTLFKSFSLISKAVSNGGEALHRFALIAGTSDEEFSKLFGEDKVQAFLKFAEGLGKAVGPGHELTTIMKAIGFQASDSARVLGAFAANSGVVRKALQESSQAATENVAAYREAHRGADTLNAAFGRLSNAIKLFVDATAEGEGGLAVALRNVVELLHDVFIIMAGIDGAFEKTSTTAHVLAGILTAVGIALAALTAGKVIQGLLNLAEMFFLSSRGATALLAVLNANPIVAVITAIGILVGAVYGLNVAMGSASDDAIKLNQHLDEMRKHVRPLQDMAEALNKANKSFEGGDAATKLASLNQQLSILTDLAAKLDTKEGFKNIFGGRGVSALTPAGKDQGAILDPDKVRALRGALEAGGVPTGFDEMQTALGRGFVGTRNQEAERQGTIVGAIKAKIDSLRDSIRLLTGDSKDMGGALTEAFNKGTVKANSFLDSLMEQNDVLQETVDHGKVAGEVLQAQQQFRKSLGDETVANEQEYLNLIEDEITKQYELKGVLEILEKQKKKNGDIDKETAEVTNKLRDEIELLRLSNHERAVRETMLEIQRKLEQEGFAQAQQMAESKRAEIDLLVTQLQTLQDLRGAGEDFGRSVGDALERMTLEGGKARDVLREMLKQIASSAFQRFGTNKLADFAGTLFAGAGAGGGGGFNAGGGVGNVPYGPPIAAGSAHGNVFNMGRLIPFARGGIIGGPMVSPMALMGEAGPEGIFPLSRSGGGLGIQSSSGGTLPVGRLSNGNMGIMGGGSITVHQTIVTPNPDAFRSSQAQIMASTKRAARIA